MNRHNSAFTILLIALSAGLLAGCSLAGGLPAIAPLPDPAEASTGFENLSIPGVPQESFRLFAENCSACHGQAGEGSEIAPPLNSQELRERLNDEALFATIRDGRPGTAMPVWGGKLSDEQIVALVALIRNWDQMDESQLEDLAAQAEDCGGGMGMHPGMGPGMGPMMGGCDQGPNGPWWWPFEH